MVFCPVAANFKKISSRRQAAQALQQGDVAENFPGMAI